MVHVLLVRLRVPSSHISQVCNAMYTASYNTPPAGSSPRLFLILDHEAGLKSLYWNYAGPAKGGKSLFPKTVRELTITP